jgi:hypothetical protein
MSNRTLGQRRVGQHCQTTDTRTQEGIPIGRYLLQMPTGFATVQDYFDLAKRDLAEMIGASVILVQSPQTQALRWHDPRTVLMRLPGGTHVARFHRPGRVFQGDESGVIRTYAETLEQFSLVPSIFTTTASDDVLTAAVVARCVVDVTHRSVLEKVARLLIQQSTRTYEGSRIAVNVCVDFGDPRTGRDAIDFFEQPWASVLGSGIASAVLVARDGTVVELEGLAGPGPAQVAAPELFAPLAGWTTGAPDRVALAATRSGEVYVFIGGEVAFVRRDSRWRGLPLGVLRTVGWFAGDHKLPVATKRDVLLALVDASAAHHGACIGIASPGRRDDALKDLVSPNDRWSNAGNPRPLLFGATNFSNLSRRHRLELLSMDGATLLDRNANILAGGAILRVNPGSSGGGRTAAAKMLGRYGVGIKVSQDGPVVAYSGANHQEIFRMG